MAKDEAVKELDRDMDTVFDSLYVINAVLHAVVQALRPADAEKAVLHLDAVIDGLDLESHPPAQYHREILYGWRNMTANIAGVAIRKPGA